VKDEALSNIEFKNKKGKYYREEGNCRVACHVAFSVYEEISHRSAAVFQPIKRQAWTARKSISKDASKIK